MQLTSLGDVYLPQAFDARDLELENVVLNLEAPVTKSAPFHPDTIDLRVPELFAEATLGAPSLAVRGPVFSAVQGPWNQRSRSSRTIRHRELSSPSQCASTGTPPVVVADLFCRLDISLGYRHRCRLALVGGKLRQTLLTAARRPQLPRWRHVERLLRQRTTRDFR